MTARKSNEPDRRPLLTTRQVAERLAMAPLTVAEMARSGRVPSVLIGRNRRYVPAEIDRYIARLPRQSA